MYAVKLEKIRESGNKAPEIFIEMCRAVDNILISCGGQKRKRDWYITHKDAYSFLLSQGVLHEQQQ